MLLIGTNDMEVPEQSNITVSTEAGNSVPISNQQSSTEYVIPSTRQRSQQQQQLLLVKNNFLVF